MTPSTNADQPIIAIDDLTRTFRGRAALDRVNLRVTRGTVLGLVGVNGAGKTTLLRHILGQLTAQSGTVRVFGLDPVADLVAVLSRVGHLEDSQELPGWMRVGEFLASTGAFYPRWDTTLSARLCEQFGLDTRARIDTLSWGLRVRTGLAAALGHRPDLLVLDEPSAGLDPLARRDILQAVIRTAADAGTTVLFSSHLLDEVERIADQVALLDAGRLVFCGDLDTIRGRHRRLTLRFEEPRRTPPALAGVLRWEGEGREWTAVCWGDLDELDVDGVVGTAGGLVSPGVRRDGRARPRRLARPSLAGRLHSDPARGAVARAGAEACPRGVSGEAQPDAPSRRRRIARGRATGMGRTDGVVGGRRELVGWREVGAGLRRTVAAGIVDGDSGGPPPEPARGVGVSDPATLAAGRIVNKGR